MKFRNHLKTYYTARIAESQPLEAFLSMGIHEKDKWLNPHLYLLVLSEHYLEEGDQDEGNCWAEVQVHALVRADHSKSNEQARQEADQLIKLFYKDLRDNRAMGTGWILRTDMEASFFYGVFEHDGVEWELAGMRFGCGFIADDF